MPRVELAGGRTPRGYSPSMHFFWGGDMPHYSPPLPFRRGRAGCRCVLASPLGRPVQGSRTCALAGVPRPVSCVAAAYVRDGRRARPRAHPRTGNSNQGCNYLVRAYSPAMYFFSGGDMPHYSPPLPFRRGREGCAGQPARVPARESRTCALAGVPRPAPGSLPRMCVLAGVPRPSPSHPLGCDSPAFLASLCSPFSRVFQFLDRYISLARNIGYVTI